MKRGDALMKRGDALMKRGDALDFKDPTDPIEPGTALNFQGKTCLVTQYDVLWGLRSDVSQIYDEDIYSHMGIKNVKEFASEWVGYPVTRREVNYRFSEHDGYGLYLNSPKDLRKVVDALWDRCEYIVTKEQWVEYLSCACARDPSREWLIAAAKWLPAEYTISLNRKEMLQMWRWSVKQKKGNPRAYRWGEQFDHLLVPQLCRFTLAGWARNPWDSRGKEKNYTRSGSKGKKYAPVGEQWMIKFRGRPHEWLHVPRKDIVAFHREAAHGTQWMKTWVHRQWGHVFEEIL